jgi:hypothetical protein
MKRRPRPSHDRIAELADRIHWVAASLFTRAGLRPSEAGELATAAENAIWSRWQLIDGQILTFRPPRLTP